MKKKAFCILGPFHSGTNLMTRILSRQFSSLQKVQKHTLSEIKVDPDVIYIFMYKNVYNWMASIKKEPYEIRFFGGFYDPIQYQNRHFDHLLALYHDYYQRYRVFLQTYPTQAVCIDYYRLIQGMNGLAYLNHQLQTIGSPGLQDQTHFLRMLSTPSKRHGKSVCHYKEALQKQEANHALYRDNIRQHVSLSHEIDQDLYDFFERDDDKKTEDNTITNDMRNERDQHVIPR